LGKTTFAQSIFNDEQVNLHFGLKLWVSVSGGFDVKKILKDVSEAAGISQVSDQLESLKNELKKKIENRKYLLVLDDVWDNKDGRDGEKWDSLKQSLPHETDRGNKMIITTRSDTIANLTSKIPLALKGLSEKDSWSLFSNKAFGPGQESNYIDEKIKKEIVVRCQGVPLVIKAIARLMYYKDRVQWLSFIKQELPNRVKDDNIIHTLKLSYDPLPSYMKHCFAYCSLFPKGHEIDVKSLIRLWIAQGFVSSSNSGGGSLEIVGLRCFELLLWRSFFHEVEKDGLGNIAKRLRTLVLLEGGTWDEGAWESICRDFRRLRVLVLSPFGMKEASPLIEKIKHLKYLDLSTNEMEALPNSITNLVNLQVLKLNGCSNFKELPRDISKLINLRHLDVGCIRDDDLCKKLRVYVLEV